MRFILGAAGLLIAGVAVAGAPGVSSAADSKIFAMRSAQACVAEARGRVTLNALGIAETLHVEVSGLPKNTDFDFFVIQVPGKPFGLS